MKTVIAIVVLLASLAPQAAAQRTRTPAAAAITGYLVDMACAQRIMKAPADKIERKAARHPRACNIDSDCAARGFALISGGTLYTLDAKGNGLALAYCTSITQEDNILVAVHGTIKDHTIAVTAIRKARAQH